MKTPRIFNLADHQSSATGGLERPDHAPSHRPLNFERFSFTPEAASNCANVSKTALMDSSDVETSDVSSVYWEMGDNGGKPGSEMPKTRGL